MSAPPQGIKTVRVDLGDRGYDVRIGPGLLDGLGRSLADALGRTPRRAFLVVDQNVRGHAGRAARGLEEGGISVAACAIAASEKAKSIDTLLDVLVAMASARLERTDVVVAIGGGITGDLGGFAAACYRRGVPVAQCPTTLLAMVDASVGGKTGVNLDVAGVLQKNMVGAFHQPAIVVADTLSLGTLPEREFRAGLAECVKHGLLGGCTGDPGHLDWIAASLGRVLAREDAALGALIERSVAFKAAIVAGDEREMADEGSGAPSRALLNLGHTFAHVIETLPGAAPAGNPGAGPLLHGEAVGLGLLGAAATSAELGLCPAQLAEEIRVLLQGCGLPVRATGLSETDDLISLMGADKKSAGGLVRLILPTPGRTARIVADAPATAIAAGWRAIGAR